MCTNKINLKEIMTNLTLISPDSLPNDNESLWRYFDIHKFLNLIKQKRFRFTRMDQFEDALEGIPFETLQKFLYIESESNQNLASIILDWPPSYITLSKESKLFGRIDEILKIQSSHFVSCWFHEQRESMAMWNLYSNPDGVALKVPFGKLKSLLNPESSQIDIQEYFCGKVQYQNFRNKDPYANDGLSKLGKVSLRKDVSFSHEKEIRFVVKILKNKGHLTGIDTEPINLKELDLKVVCHPRMVEWKKNNIKQILKDACLSDSFLDSEIKLRF